MANNFYARVKGFLEGTKARGSDVRFEYDAVESAFDSVEAIVQTDGTLAQNLKGDATYKLTGMINGTDSQDYATLANVSSEVIGGGTPGDIPITSLGVGTSTAGQSISINSGGSAVVGVSPGVKQVLRGDSAGTAVEGRGLLYGKNVVYNGGFTVNQQNVSTYSSAITHAPNNNDVMLIDGWRLLSDGNDIFDIDRHTTAADLPDGAHAAWRFDVETASKKGGMVQFVENLNTTRLFEAGNGTVSLSFKAKRTGSDMEIKAAVLAWDSTADSVTSDVVSAWGADGATPTFAANWTAENTPSDLGLSTSYQTFRIENISLDTTSTTNLAVFIWVDTTTANIGEFVYVADVQLEPGVKSTDFELEPYQVTLDKCWRYMWARYEVSSTAEFLWPGYVSGTTSYRAMAKFPVEMRTTPTLASSGAGEWRGFAGNNGLNDASTLTLLQASNRGTLIQMTVAGATDAEAGYFTTRSGPWWIRLDANL